MILRVRVRWEVVIGCLAMCSDLQCLTEKPKLHAPWEKV